MSLKFRVAQADDAAGVLAIYAPHCESSVVSFEVVAPSVEQLRGRMERVLAGYPWLVCEEQGEVTGYVYASQHRERAAYRWAVDTAVYVAPECRRRGVGKALYRTLFSILREQGFFKAFAGITLPNEASVGLHEAVSFRRLGIYSGVGYKLGRWLDVGWWQLDLQPEVPAPGEPLPFSAIRASDAVAAALTAGERLVRSAQSS